MISFNLTEEERNFLEGEIYISIDAVKEQATEYNVTYEEEFYRITAHGILHLAGYKDTSENEKKVMFGKQENYLNVLLI